MNVPPEIRFALPRLLFFVLLSLLVVEGIGAKGDFVAVLNDSFASDVNVKAAFVSVVNPKLVAVQLKLAILTVVHKYC